MKKRLTLLMMTAALTCGVLIACGQTQDDSTQTQVETQATTDDKAAQDATPEEEPPAPPEGEMPADGEAPEKPEGEAPGKPDGEAPEKPADDNSSTSSDTDEAVEAE